VSRLFTFSFDDGYQSWAPAAKCLEAAGWRGTFNVTLRSMVNSRDVRRKGMFPISDTLTWGEIEALQAAGHEIASHGTCHVDLSAATDGDLWLELSASREVFRRRGVNVTSYACPFNAAPERAQTYALSHGYRAFRGCPGINEAPVDGRIYHAQDPYRALDSIAPGRWIVSIWHDVEMAGFAAYIKLVQAIKGVQVVTVREAMRHAR
jgi:peptidoglycan/xylan/chitin deacetylase (PgdA/CDA1 family)